MLSLITRIPYNRCRLRGSLSPGEMLFRAFGKVGGMLVRSTLLLTVLTAAGVAAATADAGLADAAKNQDLKTIQSLVNQHADVNARSDDGSTALLWAAHWND